MKKSLYYCLFSLNFLLSIIPVLAQSSSEMRETVAILHIDTKGFTIEPEQMGNITRIELEKLDKFDVMDRYDVVYLLEKHEISPANCYGKICLTELGKELKVDKMLTGNVEVLGEQIVISLRLIDVGTASVVRSQIMEFLNIRQHVQAMIGLTIQKMFDLTINEDLKNKLTQQFDYESSINVPEADRLNLSGPRMGLTTFTGDIGSIYQRTEEEGGFDALPLMFQVGYQFEIKYLNQGNFQALFEFIPIITGLDQGRFIPSIVILNGLRSNKSGWEFAFGPTFFMTKEARGYYDENNNWQLQHKWLAAEPNPFPIESRFDSRGDFQLDTGFVFAFGKTFKSGRLNIPVNAFFIPNKHGHRFGLSVGYNASRYK